MGFPSGLPVKNLPEIQETPEKRVPSLGWKDPLEGGFATYSLEYPYCLERNLLPGESPWTEEPGGLQSMGSQRVG